MAFGFRLAPVSPTTPRMNTKEAFVALNMIEGLGPVRLRKLLEHFETPEAILNATKLKLIQVE